MDFPSDFGTLKNGLKFDPAKYSTEAGAAKAFYKALCKLAKDMGYDPDIEVWIKSPTEAVQHGQHVKNWWVCWESGPYEWGINLSMRGLSNPEADWYTETYWGFDVIFCR